MGGGELLRAENRGGEKRQSCRPRERGCEGVDSVFWGEKKKRLARTVGGTVSFHRGKWFPRSMGGESTSSIKEESRSDVPVWVDLGFLNFSRNDRPSGGPWGRKDRSVQKKRWWMSKGISGGGEKYVPPSSERARGGGLNRFIAIGEEGGGKVDPTWGQAMWERR